MISLLLGAALQMSPAVVTQTATNAPAQYLRVQMKVDGYGIAGNASMLVDRRTGRYFERFNLGPQSFYQGFDGLRAWQADVNGTTAIQGNDFDRGTVIAWGDLFAFPRPLPRAAALSMDSQQRLVRFSMFNGIADEVATFAEYRAFGHGVTAPGTITFTDDNGTWNAHVTGVDAVPSVAAEAFAPPRRRNDSAVASGETTVPFLVATEIVIPVRINDGPELHFILDTGGQNVLLASTAKRLGLHPFGHGTVGGAGAGLIPTSFLSVDSVRVGTAVMRNQPFIVFDSPALGGLDGILGYELLSRFAARIDYRRNILTLASAVPESWTRNVAATPFSFRSRQPAVPGAIDRFPGLIAIDTGSSGVLDINSPFANDRNLWAYYHASKPKPGTRAGVGGSYATANVTVGRLRLGTATLDRVYADLTSATAGIEAHPGFAANAGEGIFRNFTLVFDYPHQRMYFAPGGIRDLSGVILKRRGAGIVVAAVRTHAAMRAGVHPGMMLTALNGRPVSGRDFDAVEAALAGQPGSSVRLIFDRTKSVTLTLIDYL